MNELPSWKSFNPVNPDSDKQLKGPPRRFPLVVEVDCGNYSGGIADNAGGVSAPGQVFGEVDVAGAKAVNRAVAQSDFRLT